MPPPTRKEVNALIENPPAFPFQPFSLTGFARDTVSSEGMTLRDWFAGHAPVSVLESGDGSISDAAKRLGIETISYNAEVHFPILVARSAYRYADAMLEARKKQS